MSIRASIPVFEYSDYKKYLSDRLPVHGESRGARARLAATIGCQGAYVSQVLNGDTHFSLEHAVMIDEFLDHSADESRFFMLLVHYGRAGSKKLEKFYFKQIEDERRRREVISERIKVSQSFSALDQMTYYSAWYYSAIHVLVLVPELQTKTALAERLNLSMALVSEVLEFLRTRGLVEESRGHYRATSNRIHLGSDSKMISKHHTNWRLRAVRSLERDAERKDVNLHYSGAVALSRSNAEKIRKLLLSTIEAAEPIIAESGEESGYGLCLDFFEI